MPKTSIEWCDYSWPVVNGCRRVSAGCEHCYAERLAATRLRHTERYEGLARMRGATATTWRARATPQWTGKVRLVEQELDMPLRLRKPSRIFVADMGDLFYEEVPDDWIDQVFAVMALAPRHTFQVLTKRPERMRAYFHAPAGKVATGARTLAILRVVNERRARSGWKKYHDPISPLPLRNVWLGVSVEDQATADERLPPLLETPAAVRWVSYEPALGPVDLAQLRGGTFDALDGLDRECIGDIRDAGRLGVGQPERGLDWVVVGGESGPGARPMHPVWAATVRDQCVAAGVPFFFKQWGDWVPRVYVDKKHEGGPWPPPERLLNLTPKKGRETLPLESAPGKHDHVNFRRLGKKAAGRVFDGREWNELPGGSHAP